MSTINGAYSSGTTLVAVAGLNPLRDPLS